MQNTEKKTVTGSLKKAIYIIVGSISLAAGLVGVFLPVIPTTPFILLSAGCFLRSSERLFQWVVSNETLGPTIQNYHEGKGITKNTKIRAIVMMWLTISLSVYFFITNTYLIALLYVIAIGVSVYLFKLPTVKEQDS
jgi:uncharacterized protein